MTTPDRAAYSIADILPFWRWAVVIAERPDLPGIPFYREASARVLIDELRDRFPERTIQLLHRCFGGVEVRS